MSVVLKIKKELLQTKKDFLIHGVFYEIFNKNNLYAIFDESNKKKNLNLA